MRRRSRPARSLIAALALALGLTACGGDAGDTQALADNLQAQQEAIDALRARVTDLSDEVGAVTSLDPMTGLSDLATQLDDLTSRLEQVETTVSAQASSEDVTATVAAEVGKFSEQIDALVASVNDLSTLVSQLRTDLDDLEQRFQDHADDPFAHNRGTGD